MTLRVEDLAVTGPTGGRLLEGVTARFAPGEVAVILGENGAGKTTLLDRLAGVKPPSEGRVLLDGRELSGLPALERAQRVASLGQSDVVGVGLTALARIGQGLVPRRGARALLDEGGLRRVEAAARQLAVDDLLGRELATLSGGERRRVHVARGLVDDETEVVVLDEPHAGVDARHRPLVSRAVRARAEAGAAVILSVHDLDVALDVADRVLGLSAGRVVLDGPPGSVLDGDGLRALYGIDARVVTVEGRRGVVHGPTPA